jgi:acetylornithine deacetylase/succinyl-diaminopimelate desuccinylase-like protein
MEPIPAGEVGELLTALIANACVNDGTPDSGHEFRSVATLDGFLGTPERVFEPHPGRQSALYRVPGRDPGAPSLMLLGHLDVVPVTPSGWSVDPFAGERKDGFIWGRGAVDMLNQTAAMAAVFKRFRTGDADPLPGDLLFLAVADEEAAGKLGASVLVAEHWDQVACDFLLTEIGSPMLSGRSGPGLPVTVAEKGPHWRRLATVGVPGHGSQPYGTDNALVPLADAVARLGREGSAVVISDEWRRFVEAWDPEPDLASALVDPDRIDDAIEALALDDLGMGRWAHACTHLTVSPNTLRGGVKANVVPDRAVAEIDIRLLPGQDRADLDDHFRKVLGPSAEEIEIHEIESTPAGGSAPAGPLWEAIGDALEVMAGHRRMVPTMIPVATDARFFRRHGTVAFGMALFDDRLRFGDLLSMFHGNDERVSEASLALTADHLAVTVTRFGERTA